MQHTFGEWYEPSDSTLKKIFESGTIALDANVLLDLYRTGTNQRTQILSVFERPEVQPRVWIPYQVGLEFHRNRLDVARQHQPLYEKIRQDVDKMKTVLDGAISGIRDSEIQKSIRNIVQQRLGAAAEAITNHLNEQERQHVISYDEIRVGDPLRKRLDNILAEPSQVGPEPSPETIEERKKKAVDRYEREVPPGYRDANKPDNSDGDVLIWFEILDHAEKVSRPVLFVTSDVKPDWYRREAGDTLGPRPELRAEFATRSKHPYHQVRLSTFLHLSNQYLNAGVSGETIDSVEALAEDRRVAYRKTTIAKLQHRLNQDSTRRDLKLLLSRYEPGSEAYETIMATLDMVDGGRKFNANLVSHALRLLDRAIEDAGSNGGSDVPDDRQRTLDKIRRHFALLDPHDMGEKKAIDELSASLDSQKLLEFLDMYDKVRNQRPNLRLRRSEDGFKLMDGTETVFGYGDG